MADFSRYRPVYGNPAADYAHHAPQDNAPRHQPPTNHFGFRGRIASMLDRRAQQLAERQVNYVFGMQEQLQAEREYRETGTYHQPLQGQYGQGTHDAHSASAGAIHPQVLQIFGELEARIHGIERQLAEVLEALRGRMEPGRASPATSLAGTQTGTAAHRIPPSVAGDPQFPEPAVRHAAHVSDAGEEDTEEALPTTSAPPLPARPRPQPQPQPQETTRGADAGRPPPLPARNAPVSAQPNPAAAPLPSNHFLPPPLHPSHPQARQRQAQIEASRAGIDIERWRLNSASITTSEPEQADEDHLSDITTASRHQSHVIPRRPVAKPAPRSTLPGESAGTDSASRDEHAAQAAATLRSNARVEAELAEEGRKAAERLLR